MRSKLYYLFTMLFVLTLCAAPAVALAQDDTTTIIFDGKEVTGDTAKLTAIMLGGVRPAIAVQDKPFVVNTDGEEFSPYEPDTCFGVVERQADYTYKLLETIYLTDLSGGRYDAVVPTGDAHGDWPPHLVNFTIESTQPIGCDELVAEISYRMVYEPDADGALSFTFYLDPEFLDTEYDVMASNGDLGLFVASPVETELTVNGETFMSQGCSDCLDHTAAVTDTIGAGVYSPATVTWLSETTEDPTALNEMYVLPVPKVAGVEYTVTVEADKGETVVLWFGRFDMSR